MVSGRAGHRGTQLARSPYRACVRQRPGGHASRPQPAARNHVVKVASITRRRAGLAGRWGDLSKISLPSRGAFTGRLDAIWGDHRRGRRPARLVGGREVMRSQLARLHEAAAAPNTTIQAIPFDAGAIPAWTARSSCWSSPTRPTRASCTPKAQQAGCSWKKAKRSCTQTGPYRVRSSTMGIMTVSVRAGCETGPVNSTV